jgi:hypothetical protein
LTATATWTGTTYLDDSDEGSDDPSKGDVPVHAAVAVKVHDHVDVNDYVAQRRRTLPRFVASAPEAEREVLGHYEGTPC